MFAQSFCKDSRNVIFVSKRITILRLTRGDNEKSVKYYCAEVTSVVSNVEDMSGIYACKYLKKE